MLTASARTVLLRLIRVRFGDYKQDSDEIKVNCPWCVKRGRPRPDTGQKLWINIKKNLYHCWRCNAGGQVSDLFPQLATEFHQTYVPENSQPIQKAPLEPLPTDLIPLDKLPSNHLIHEYLREERRSTVDELLPYAQFCGNYRRTKEDGYEHSYGPRIIFPIEQAGRYCGFQGRTIWRNTEPKYVGALGMEKKKLLWNYDRAIRGSRIILVEGVFDAIRIGAEGAAIFGKAISDEQVRLLQLGNFQQVIFWLDADAQVDCEQSARRLAKYFPSYMLRTNKFKDAGETPKDIIQEIISTSIERVY